MICDSIIEFLEGPFRAAGDVPLTREQLRAWLDRKPPPARRRDERDWYEFLEAA